MAALSGGVTLRWPHRRDAGTPREKPMSVIEIDEVVEAVATDAPCATDEEPSNRPAALVRPWWLVSAAVGVALTALVALSAIRGAGASRLDPGTLGWWVVTTVLHLPYAVILCFLLGGVVERVGYYWRGRALEPTGRLPHLRPTVCVQLPMYNEHAVARRVIEAACAMSWPIDRLSVQVLDDSTDADTRALVAEVCERMRASTGVDCRVHNRADRRGYKAGALEEGRLRTDAELLAIFDSDFVPTQDFLERTIPHFYLPDGEPDDGLALVQAQWGHLNHDESSLTLAQSLWVDDHHTLQMSWRSARWQFVNFTGTAGVWRASAIDAVGGWRAASLVEDCELSFRHLFAGYRTKFVKEVVVPAELPATYTAYKAQQRRWTQGWVQLQRLHLGTLLFGFRCSAIRRLHLAYHMCIAWQWPAWAIWMMTLPLMIYGGHWFGSLSTEAGALVYLVPSFLWAILVGTLATLETRHTYADGLTAAVFLRRVRRVVPYLVVNTGMLPHQFSSFAEGLFGGMNSEFERTPKAASVRTGAAAGATADDTGQARAAARPAPRSYQVKIHWPYVSTEAFYVAYQLAWTLLFATAGLAVCALGAAYMALCVLFVAFFYGDHVGKVAFLFDKPARSGLTRRRSRQAGVRGRLPAGQATV
jgi:cellulose synthase/poly-beta-1,6-N-acetylglucosamine synthase-like glycosyltransferase